MDKYTRQIMIIVFLVQALGFMFIGLFIALGVEDRSNTNDKIEKIAEANAIQDTRLIELESQRQQMIEYVIEVRDREENITRNILDGNW